MMDDLSMAWLDWSRGEHVPVNTVKSRTRVLHNIGNAGTATREEVEAWWMTRRDLAPATRNNDLTNLRTFYKWTRRWEYRDDDPTLRLDAPHVPNGLPRPMSRADLHKALAVLAPDLRRAVCLGAYAGMRVSEAADLDWADVDVDARQIRVMRSKGGKSRVVPISPVLVDEILPNTGGSVVSAGGTPYTAETLQRKANRALRAMGINSTFHQLRHRYGTLAYQATGDLLAVGKLMGHSSPVTTAVYAAANDDVAAKIALAVVR